MRDLLIVISLTLTVFVFWNCSAPENEYSDFHTLPATGWIYGDTIDCDMPTFVTDSAVSADIALIVTHSNAYQYSNLWLEVSRTINDSIVIADTVNITLADIYGNWLGKGSGLAITKTDTIMRDVSLVHGHPLKLRHIMRSDTLSGIDRIGVVIIAK